MEIALNNTKITKSRKDFKNASKFDFRMEPKQQHLFQYASRSLLRIWFVIVAFDLKMFLKKGSQLPILASPGWIWAKSKNKCEGQ